MSVGILYFFCLDALRKMLVQETRPMTFVHLPLFRSHSLSLIPFPTPVRELWYRLRNIIVFRGLHEDC